MGLKPEWKKLLQKEFSSAWISSIPQTHNVDVVIDDFSIYCHQGFYGIEAGREVLDRCKARLLEYLGESVKEYIVLFDEHEYQPRNKEICHRSRSKGQNPIPNEIVERDHMQITDASWMNISTVLDTPLLRDDFYRFCTEKLTVMQMEYKKEPFVVVVDGARERTGHKIATQPMICYITKLPLEGETDKYQRKWNKYSSAKKGESDLKILRYVNKHKGDCIVVRSNDADSIVLLLLNMRNLIDLKSGEIDTKIYLDTSKGKQERTGDYLLDVVSLWRAIIVYFQINFPGLNNSIEMLCILMLLSGGDYIQFKFPQLGPVTIWNAFKLHWRLFKDEHGPFIEKIPPPEKTILYGNYRDRIGIKIKESMLYDFVCHCYILRFPGLLSIYSVFKAPRKVSSLFYIRQTLKNAEQKENNKRWKNHQKEKKSMTIQTDDQAFAIFRRIYWTLDYWMNGAENNFVDPLEKDPDQGTFSLYGWEEDSNGYIVESEKVWRSKMRAKEPEPTIYTELDLDVWGSMDSKTINGV